MTMNVDMDVPDRDDENRMKWYRICGLWEGIRNSDTLNLFARIMSICSTFED